MTTVEQRRLRANALARKNYHKRRSDPEYRARENARRAEYQRSRYRSDPAYRQRNIDYLRATYAERYRAHRDRLARDPEYRNKHRAPRAERMRIRRLTLEGRMASRAAHQASYRRRRDRLLSAKRERYWTDPEFRTRNVRLAAASYRSKSAAAMAARRSYNRDYERRRRIAKRLAVLNPSKPLNLASYKGVSMTPDKSHQLIKEWRKIMADKKSVDYRLAQWAHNVRSEFPAGTTGDTKCSAWLNVELGLTKGEQVEMLLLARSFKVVPDQEIWTEQGATQIRKLVDLPKAEQVAALSAAKAEKRKIGSVLKSRADAASFRAGRADQPDDAKILARFARGLSDAVLADIAARAVTSDNTMGATPAIVDAARRHMARLRNRSTPIRRAA